MHPLPFRIGRQPDNHLILRDTRASRQHAQILFENGAYVLEDTHSRYGVWVNGKRIQRQELHNSDRIEFGVPESYQLVFALDGAELSRLMEQLTPRDLPASPGGSSPAAGNLARLRAVLEVGRALETSLSTDDVLSSVVDAALAVTGAERGFLLLRQGAELATRVARNRQGQPLSDSDLQVPRRVLQRALEQRRDLLSMNFDPQGQAGIRPEQSIADLELRSVISVPLVRINTSAGAGATSIISTADQTVGVLYMDSRIGRADLAGGNRELLQTLAIEASTVLENARLLEEERAKQKIEEELNLARSIQRSLLPRQLPSAGWFRAAGNSVASHQVGGDYFDVLALGTDCWTSVVADVSGKGVSSALLASLVQGAFILGNANSEAMLARVRGLNRFLFQRTEGEKYATVFCCMLARDGRLQYLNAGHCPPLVVHPEGAWEYLETTGTPVGLMEAAEFAIGEKRLAAGDKIVIYSDGLTEAQNSRGEFFGRKRLRQSALAHAQSSCQDMHEAIQNAVTTFTEAAPQSDDLTLVVLEYQPENAG